MRKIPQAIMLTLALIAVLASCARKDRNAQVTDISLNHTEAALELGKSLELVPVILPQNAANKNIAWRSSNSAVLAVRGNAIATAQYGTVTALHGGTATITATTEDGNQEASCVVRVVPPLGAEVVSVAAVSLNKAKDTLFVGHHTTLAATVLPENAFNKDVAWTSSSAAIAAVHPTNERCIVAALAEGVASITTTTQDGGKTADFTLLVLPLPEGAAMVLGRVAWAAANVDSFQRFANRPDMYTKHYQWGRSKAWAATDSISEAWEDKIADAAWATNPCPAGWRLPAKAEYQALHDEGSTWAAANTRGNAVAGRFYGPNHATCTLPDNMVACLFFPASGRRHNADGRIQAVGTNGYGWSSTPANNTTSACCLNFYIGDSYPAAAPYKSYAFSLRCVQDI